MERHCCCQLMVQCRIPATFYDKRTPAVMRGFSKPVIVFAAHAVQLLGEASVELVFSSLVAGRDSVGRSGLD